MSHDHEILTIRVRVVTVLSQPGKWIFCPVEAGDAVFRRVEDSEPGQQECDAGEFFEALTRVHSAGQLVSFIEKFGDPGIHESEYMGTQEFRFGQKLFTYRNHGPRSEPKLFLSQVRDFRKVLKEATEKSHFKWDKQRWFDPDDMSIELRK